METCAFNGMVYCPTCADAEREAEEAERRKADEVTRLRMGIDPKFWGADFTRCDDRILAVAAAKQWAANPSGIMLIHGMCGRGKTFLAAAAKKEFNRRGVNSRMVSEDEILLTIKSSFGKEAQTTEREAYQKFTGSAPLIIDDIGTSRVTDFTYDMWETIIGRRYREDAPTLITSNYPIAALEKRVGVRVTERIIESKMVYEYVGENRRRAS